MEISRTFCMPNKWTFQMKPVKQLLEKYVKEEGKGWIDPFAGFNSPAEFTNDLNPEAPTKFHLKAVDFVTNLEENMYKGVLFDPPYSPTQIKTCYDSIGISLFKEDTTSEFYWKVKREIAKKLPVGALAISFGWNSTGFGVKYGFKKLELLILNHGSSHNDTLILVEQKIKDCNHVNKAL